MTEHGLREMITKFREERWKSILWEIVIVEIVVCVVSVAVYYRSEGLSWHLALKVAEKFVLAFPVAAIISLFMELMRFELLFFADASGNLEETARHVRRSAAVSARVGMKCISLRQQVHRLEERVAAVEASPIGRYIDVSLGETTSELASAVDGLLMEAGSSRKSREELNETAELVRMAGCRVSANHETVRALEGEEQKFREVEDCLVAYPCTMRFTDIRSPRHWDFDNNLHNLTIAAITSFLSRPASTFDWRPLPDVGPDQVMTRSIADAVTQCLRNFDNYLISKKTALGHCRRWIGCKKWNPQLNDQNKRMVATKLFHGCTSQIERKMLIELAGNQFRSAAADCCVDCGLKRHSCEGVDPTMVRSLLQETLRNDDLMRVSIYDASTLNQPIGYWPPNMANELGQILMEDAPLVICPENNATVTDTDRSVFDCCRFLIWLQPYLEEEQAQVRLWDSLLGVPNFWINPQGGFRLGDGTSAVAIEEFFYGSGRDYVLLERLQHGSPIAYSTSVHGRTIPVSERLDERQRGHLLTQCGDLLRLIGDPTVPSDPEEKRLLAPHALFAYLNKGGH